MKTLLGSFFLISLILFSFSDLKGAEVAEGGLEDKENHVSRKYVSRKQPTHKESPWRELSLTEKVNERSQLGIICMQEKRYTDAWHHLIFAAELKNSGSRYNLGILYEYGLGVEKSLEEAAKWYSACGLDFPNASKALDRVISQKQQILEHKNSFLRYVWSGIAG